VGRIYDSRHNGSKFKLTPHHQSSCFRLSLTHPHADEPPVPHWLNRGMITKVPPNKPFGINTIRNPRDVDFFQFAERPIYRSFSGKRNEYLWERQMRPTNSPRRAGQRDRVRMATSFPVGGSTYWEPKVLGFHRKDLSSRSLASQMSLPRIGDSS
jgi:hypothetical protein